MVNHSAWPAASDPPFTLKISIDKLRRRSPCCACAAIGQTTAPPSPVITPAVSFDHLVGDREQVRRNGKAERLGGLEVHGHLKFCRELHREVRRSGAS